MAVLVSGSGGGGKPYTGDNPLTIGQAGFTFPAKTLLKDGLQIINGVNGEDLTDTVADQTTAVEELMKMVSRKIAMNNGEGQFVWKKLTAEGGDFIDFVVSADTGAYPNGGTQDDYWYELVEEGSDFGTNVWNKYASYTPARTLGVSFSLVSNTPSYSDPNIYLDVKVSNGTPADITLNDLADFNIITWTYYSKSAVAKITSVSSATQATGVVSSNGTNYNAVFYYNQSTGRLQINSRDGYPMFEAIYYSTGYTCGSKNVTRSAEFGERLGFVVSDDASEFPNGGTDSYGFYYTLLGHVDSANVMSLSNNAYDVVETEVVNGIVNEVGGVGY